MASCSSTLPLASLCGKVRREGIMATTSLSCCRMAMSSFTAAPSGQPARDNILFPSPFRFAIRPPPHFLFSQAALRLQQMMCRQSMGWNTVYFPKQ
ncbi:hypothetical protein IEQ34_010130 [Dendrobium chrysotoxum]|uniref:Uncharacterized protein n=1 Tax=Dendrobium chrysotoxum TaxID=161865 RepID=A0AAV7GL33_DENCH|nr:hypothetical protein IEQ34_010130 [Dendrobium chrysotoxum]